jgi:hypothetical protein
VQNAIPTLGHKTHARLWGLDALFTYGYEKIKLQRDIKYEISVSRYETFIYGFILNET